MRKCTGLAARPLFEHLERRLHCSSTEPSDPGTLVTDLQTPELAPAGNGPFTATVATFRPSAALERYSADVVWPTWTQEPPTVVPATLLPQPDGTIAVVASLQLDFDDRPFGTALLDVNVDGELATEAWLSFTPPLGIGWNYMPHSVARVAGGPMRLAPFYGPDGATAGDFAVDIDWGDGSTSAGSITPRTDYKFDLGHPNEFDIWANHVYSKAGAYQVTTTVRSIAGASAGVVVTSESLLQVWAEPDGANIYSDQATLWGYHDYDLIVASKGDTVSGTLAHFTGKIPAEMNDQITIDWGDRGGYGEETYWRNDDGSGNAVIVPDGDGGFYVQASHTYYRDDYSGGGPYDVTVGVGGWWDEQIASVSLFVIPFASQPIVSSPAVSDAFMDVSAQTGTWDLARFYDFDPQDASAYNVTIDWGDGSPATTGTVTHILGNTYRITGEHKYRRPGEYYRAVTLSRPGVEPVDLYTEGVLMLGDPLPEDPPPPPRPPLPVDVEPVDLSETADTPAAEVAFLHPSASSNAAFDEATSPADEIFRDHSADPLDRTDADVLR